MQFTSLVPPVRLTSHPSLAQAPEAVPAPVMPAAAGGEPSLQAVLASLTPEEAADYRAWGSKEKLLFLMGYQWLSVMTAPELKRPDGSPFIGVLPQFADAAYEALKAAEPYFKKLPADMSKAADGAASIVWDARIKTEARGRETAKRYRLLRDRVAWELAISGVTVEFDVVGDDPSNPGVLFVRKIGEDKGADISAVFSGKTPKELWEDGLKLQDKYEDAGVVFKKLDMSGTGKRLAVGPPAVLAVVIGVVVLVLGFFWLWRHLQEEKRLNDLAVRLIMDDPTLSDVDRADRIRRLKGADAMWASIFGSGGFPFGSILLGAAVIGIAFFLAPAYLPSIISGGRAA